MSPLSPSPAATAGLSSATQDLLTLKRQSLDAKRQALQLSFRSMSLSPKRWDDDNDDNNDPGDEIGMKKNTSGSHRNSKNNNNNNNEEVATAATAPADEEDEFDEDTISVCRKENDNFKKENRILRHLVLKLTSELKERDAQIASLRLQLSLEQKLHDETEEEELKKRVIGEETGKDEKPLEVEVRTIGIEGETKKPEVDNEEEDDTISVLQKERDEARADTYLLAMRLGECMSSEDKLQDQIQELKAVVAKYERRQSASDRSAAMMAAAATVARSSSQQGGERLTKWLNNKFGGNGGSGSGGSGGEAERYVKSIGPASVAGMSISLAASTEGSDLSEEEHGNSGIDANNHHSDDGNRPRTTYLPSSPVSRVVVATPSGKGDFWGGL